MYPRWKSSIDGVHGIGNKICIGVDQTRNSLLKVASRLIFVLLSGKGVAVEGRARGQLETSLEYPDSPPVLWAVVAKYHNVQSPRPVRVVSVDVPAS